VLRLVFTSDLHGNLALYEAAAAAALNLRVDALILGGDLCPGVPSASSTELPQFQPEFLRRSLGPTIESWKRARPALQVFVIPGNDDCQTVLPVLAELEEEGLIHNLQKKTAMVGDCTLMGLAFVPPTPFSIKDFERWDQRASVRGPTPPHARPVRSTSQGFQPIEDFTAYLNARPTIQEEISQLPVTDPFTTILVAHCPPYGTHCDALYSREHIGSRAIRQWTESRQPRLTLHGHIHESPQVTGFFWDKVGETTVVNPGSDGWRPHWVLIEIGKPIKMKHSIYGTQDC